MTCLNNAAVSGCYNGTPVVLHYTYDNSGQPQVRITDIAGAVVAGANAANTRVGDCPPIPRPIISSGLNLASGTLAATYDPVGHGATWTAPAGYYLQSFTVTVLRGSGLPSGTDHVTVTNTKTGQTLHMLQGETRSWSVGQEVNENEYLYGIFTVACTGNAACGIHWTGQVA